MMNKRPLGTVTNCKAIFCCSDDPTVDPVLISMAAIAGLPMPEAYITAESVDNANELEFVQPGKLNRSATCERF